MIEPTDLIGTWQFTREGEPPLKAFLHFTYTQAFDYLADGESWQMMRLWYSLEEPGLIRFRNRPEDDGWTCGIRMLASALIITGEDAETFCTRAAPTEIPEWFCKELSLLS